MTKHQIGWVILGIVVILIMTAWFSGQVDLSTHAPDISPESHPTSTGTLIISPYGAKQKLIELLSEAKYTIRIRIYQLDDPNIIQLLRNKAYLGVSVYIIVENAVYGDEEGGGYEDLQEDLQGSNIHLQTDEHLGTNFMHAKTILIDDTTYIISTANMTYPSFFMNREYRFVGHDTGTVESLIRMFHQDRENSPSSGSVILPEALRICPYNCREQVMDMLDAATTAIRIEAQYLEDDAIQAKLEEKIAQGTEVDLLRGKYQNRDTLWDIVNNSRFLADPNIHAKNILIDDEFLYIGSMNLSTNAIENNREIGIVVADPSVVSKFNHQFDLDRDAAHSF